MSEESASMALERAAELFRAGGPVVVILALMSVVALAIILLKLWQFRVGRIGDTSSARRAVELYVAGRRGEAGDLVAGTRSPVARLTAAAMEGLDRPQVPESRVREEVHRLGADMLESLRAYLRPLEVIGSLAPLLGLFGTVLGMIEAFQELEAAGSQVDPAVLSGGIWQALLTTAAGLAVAIPVVALLSWLERRVDRVAHEMDTVVTRLFTADLYRDHAVEADERADRQSGPARAAAGE